MKKVFFGSQVFSWQKYGGISKYVCQLASALSKRSDVSLLLLSGFHDNVHVREIDDGAIEVFGIDSPWLMRGRRFSNTVIDRIALNISDCDVYHASSYGPIPKTSVPVVITCHDCVHEEMPDTEDPSGVLAKGKIDSLMKADKVICISETTRKALIKYYDFPKEKLHTVYHGVSTPLKQHGRIISDDYILHVGNRSGYKNAPLLFKAFSMICGEYPNLKLVLAGGKPLTKHELSQLEFLGIKDKTIHIPIDHNILEGLYQHALMFVFPSSYEGFGMPVLEAMINGCPVIVSDGGALPEIAGGAAVIFSSGDADALASSIMKVATDAIETKRLRSLGFARASEFSWERCAAETVTVYRELV